jgi:hypothetical protein
MNNMYLEELLPIAMQPSGELLQLQAPATLELPGELADSSGPGIFWIHNVDYADEAVILCQAGSRPVAARITAGNGVVAVF